MTEELRKKDLKVGRRFGNNVLCQLRHVTKRYWDYHEGAYGVAYEDGNMYYGITPEVLSTASPEEGGVERDEYEPDHWVVVPFEFYNGPGPECNKWGEISP